MWFMFCNLNRKQTREVLDMMRDWVKMDEVQMKEVKVVIEGMDAELQTARTKVKTLETQIALMQAMEERGNE